MIKKIFIIGLLSFQLSSGMNNQQQIILKDLKFSPWPALIRYLSIDQQLPQGTIIAKLNRYRKIADIETYRRLNIDLIMLIQRYDIPAGRIITPLSSLVYQGADPDFTTLRWARTPLMLSVRANKKELVEFFIDKNANCLAVDYNNWNVRRFNLIYDAKQLADIIPSLFSYLEQKLILETNEVTYMQDVQARKDFEKDLKFITAQWYCKKFFMALDIDRMLEDKGVPSPCTVDRAHPLINLLRNNKYLRNVIRRLFIRFFPDESIAAYMPENVYKTLKASSRK